jgi:glycosyltransferase involved in cell wall biosynthesis
MPPTPSVDIVIPCLNEEKQLPASLETLRHFCTGHLAGYRWRIVTADNGSTDGTLARAQEFVTRYPDRFGAIYLPQRGRGRALRKAWLESEADAVCYMDVDLSTDIAALPALVSAVTHEGYDVAIGSRLAKGSRVEKRTLKREVISRCYNLMIKAMFFTHFSDAQCGFKAMSRRAVQEIIPVTEDLGWFLDSEILIIAEKRGYRIKDIPVHWVDDPDTRVKIVKTAWGDVKGLMRLRFGGIPRPQRQSSPSLTAEKLNQ